MFVLNILLLVLAIGISIPIAVFCVECLLSVLLGSMRTASTTGEPTRVAVLIPAHNEEHVVVETLNTLLPTLKSGDRAVVIADNCSDATAELARSAGAIVVERFDRQRRGKAFALEFGLSSLQNDPPDVVVVLDADCSVEPSLVRRISELAHARNRPVQGRNLSVAGKQGNPVHAVSELGFRFKNLVRPLGVAKLGLPCHLMGTGMAIPWKLFRETSLAGDHLAEDMQFGVELALKGHAALFCPEV
ncbi:MAG: glycosyltransferase, partial [Planctomycetes bacterium]|nr:glycosyltransferase [Planctomycetota bacterium]